MRYANYRDVPIALVSEMLSYFPETGIVKWRVRRAGSAWPGDIAGSKDGDGYLRTSIFRNAVTIHRIAWALHYGAWPEGGIDHINRDKTDNRIANLRLATVAQNNANRGVMATNTHGDKGVTKLPSGKWQAQIQSNRKSKYLGCFAEKADAIAAYEKAAIQAFGDFAGLMVKP